VREVLSNGLDHLQGRLGLVRHLQEETNLLPPLPPLRPWPPLCPLVLPPHPLTVNVDARVAARLTETQGRVHAARHVIGCR